MYDGKFAYEEKHGGYDRIKIANLIHGKEEGKQVYYNIYRDVIVGYYYAKNNKKEGENVIFDIDGEQIAKGIYKDDKPYEGQFLINNMLLNYEKGKRFRQKAEIDKEENKKRARFIKNSNQIEGMYNLSGFEMASSLALLNSNYFYFSLSVGSKDIITYGDYYFKNNKLKFRINEEQKQTFVVYVSNNKTLKNTRIRYYSYVYVEPLDLYLYLNYLKEV